MRRLYVMALALGAALAAPAPQLNLAHLDSLLVPVTIDGRTYTGTAVYAEPDPSNPARYVVKEAPGEGLVDLDDVARAAVVYLRDGKPESLSKARKLLELTMRLQTPVGEFYNFVFADGRINTDGPTSRAGAGFWAARAVWALAEGVIAFDTTDPPYARQLEAALTRALPPFAAKVSPRFGQYRDIQGRRVPAWLPDDGGDIGSILAVGLARYLRVRPNAAVARTLLEQLSDGLAAYQPGQPDEFPFLLHLPNARDPWSWHAWGSRQVQALALAGQVLGRDTYLESARASAGHMLVHLIASGGPIEGLTPAPDPYPQIAYGMESLASGLFALADATGQSVWNELGGLMTAWIMGENDNRQAMYDPATGRVFDGLERVVYNQNAGAESTITGLLALQLATARPAASAMLGLARLERTTDLVLEAEDGTDFGLPPPAITDTRASGGRLAALEPGASLTLPVETPGGQYVAHLVARRGPGAGRAVLFAGRTRVGEANAEAAGETYLAVLKLGRLELPAGKTRLILSQAGDKKLDADAVWLFPAVERKLLGEPGRRVLLLKSWSDKPEPISLPQANAQVQVYDRLGRSQPTSSSPSLPPFGFALAQWTSSEPLPNVRASGRPTERLTVAALPAVGRFLPLDLAAAFNGDAFSTSTDPLRGNFDNHAGPRGATYPAERSPAPGARLEAAGTTFVFPRTDQPNNMLTARGQTLAVPSGRYARLQLLGSAEQGAYRETVRLRYADGPEGSAVLALSDWCQAPQFGETIAVDYPVRRDNTGSLEAKNCRIYAQSIPLDPARELREIVLPDRETIHLFALTLERAP